MWVPTSAVEVEQAVNAGQLVETHTFDGKALPGKNKDIAIDVCAMTPDGGSLLYGVGQDENHRLTELTPFPLAGERERIDQIVATSIFEVPTVVIRELPTDSDPAVGYIAVGVPQSARAPHQVIVGNDMRYYGRGATGNRRLTEREVADLYARRKGWEVSREELLEAEFEYWRDRRPPGSEFGYLYAFTRPVVADSDLLEQAANGGTDMAAVLASLLVAGKKAALPTASEPGLTQSPLSWFRRGAEGWELRQEEPPRNAGHLLLIQVDRNGHCRLFCDRAAQVLNDGFGTARRLILEGVILGTLASFFAVAGELYRLAGYIGAVDVGMHVGYLAGGISVTLVGRPSVWGPPPFETDDFRSTQRVMAPELVQRPRELALKVTRHLLEATAGADWDPWGLETVRPGEPNS